MRRVTIQDQVYHVPDNLKVGDFLLTPDATKPEDAYIISTQVELDEIMATMEYSRRLRAWDGFNGEYFYSHDLPSMSAFWMQVEKCIAGGNYINVEESTGMPDEDGDELYQGDIVKVIGYNDEFPEGLAIIGYDPYRSWFNLVMMVAIDGSGKPTKAPGKDQPIQLVPGVMTSIRDRLKRLGNIHEDKEILD